MAVYLRPACACFIPQAAGAPCMYTCALAFSGRRERWTLGQFLLHWTERRGARIAQQHERCSGGTGAWHGALQTTPPRPAAASCPLSSAPPAGCAGCHLGCRAGHQNTAALLGQRPTRARRGWRPPPARRRPARPCRAAGGGSRARGWQRSNLSRPRLFESLGTAWPPGALAAQQGDPTRTRLAQRARGSQSSQGAGGRAPRALQHRAQVPPRGARRARRPQQRGRERALRARGRLRRRLLRGLRAGRGGAQRALGRRPARRRRGRWQRRRAGGLQRVAVGRAHSHRGQQALLRGAQRASRRHEGVPALGQACTGLQQRVWSSFARQTGNREDARTQIAPCKATQRRAEHAGRPPGCSPAR